MKFNRGDTCSCQDNNMAGMDYANMPAREPMMQMDMGCCNQNVMMCQPIYECPQVQCCHRVINYEVPHIIPCHTKMINHHIYKHTYQPCYSYSEEDETSEVYGPRCC